MSDTQSAKFSQRPDRGLRQLGFSEDPQLARGKGFAVREALMGDIIQPGSVPMRLAVEVIGTAPIERLDVLHGAKVVQTARPFTAADLGPLPGRALP